MSAIAVQRRRHAASAALGRGRASTTRITISVCSRLVCVIGMPHCNDLCNISTLYSSTGYCARVVVCERNVYYNESINGESPRIENKAVSKRLVD